MPLLKGEIATRDGAGQWKFQIKYPQWGRYLVRVVDPQSGHAAGQAVYIDWPGWAGRAREEKGSGATRLNFSADKERYQVGEKATVFLPDAPQGRALVSLENNSRILKQMWVSTQSGANRFRDRARREHEPQHLRACHPAAAPFGQEERHPHPPVRRDPGHGGEPQDPPGAAGQGGRRAEAHGGVQGGGAGEGGAGHDLHPGRGRRGAAGADALHRPRPAQALLQPRGPGRPHLGPFRRRGRGLRRRPVAPAGAGRRRGRGGRGRREKTAPFSARRPLRRAFRAGGRPDGGAQVQDAAIRGGGAGHGRGRPRRRLRRRGKIGAGAPGPDDPAHPAAGRAAGRAVRSAGVGVRQSFRHPQRAGPGRPRRPAAHRRARASRPSNSRSRATRSSPSP